MKHVCNTTSEEWLNFNVLNYPNVNRIDYQETASSFANHIRVENPRQIPTLGIVWGYFFALNELELFNDKWGKNILKSINPGAIEWKIFLAPDIYWHG